MKNFALCPTCGSPTQPTKNVHGADSTGWLECSRCNTYINTYVPMPHQMAVHLDDHRFILNAGAYGTGKTTTSRQEVYRHALITPHGNTLIGAKTTSQYEQTIKRELESDLPMAFVKDRSQQKAYIDLINGHRILFRPFDDPDKLRSYNLSMFVIIEASETPAEAFHQLKTRLRNQAATHTDQLTDTTADWRRGIIETNPSAGWVRSDALMNAETVHTYGNTLESYQPSLTPDVNISAHIAATDANTYLPPNFIQEITINKPLWWVNKFVHGSFMYAEGLVYPSARRCIVEAFEPPLHWPKIIAADYGLSDKFAYLMGAIDPKDGICYLYRNRATTNRNIEELSKIFFEMTEDVPVGGFYTAPILDPRSGAKRDYNKKTLYDHFMDYGIYFQPGHVSVDARIFRLNTYLESGRMRIMDCCTELIEEIEDYKFPERTLEATARAASKPIDKNNHSINPAEWIAMALPSNPAHLVNKAYDSKGNVLGPQQVTPRNEENWQLSDDSDYLQPEVQSQWLQF